jgi:hypothetical protein
LCLPPSITTTTSSSVTLVSAMLVLSTILRVPAGGTLKAARCWSALMAECSGSSQCLPRLYLHVQKATADSVCQLARQLNQCSGSSQCLPLLYLHLRKTAYSSASASNKHVTI